jgi:dihydrofolate reductase
MAKLCVRGLAISLDGYAAGPDQDLDNPLGVGGGRLHEWVFETRTGRQMIGEPGGDDGTDDQFMARANDGIGATIMGRNMFGPIRGPWGGEDWTGWWGDTPPYHHPVFVLTHHRRDPIAMDGGTTFHFVDDGIESALDQATAAAGGANIRLGGGTSTIQQYLRVGLIDELHLVIVPILLGSGERFFDHLDGGPDGYECVELVSSPAVTHIRLERAAR